MVIVLCGIYGKVGNISTNEMIDKLKLLEYRGYDSCGVAFTSQDKSFIYKACGNTSNLENVIDYHVADKCIAHTRWATHGEVSVLNAHPHTTSNNRFIIVHNGVIDNYLSIKEEYNIDTISQTDTEIVVHLFDKISLLYKDTLEMIKYTMTLLEGSYAILVLDKNSDKIYFMKNKSPLLISRGNDSISIASDQIAFDKNDEVIILNDLDCGYIDNDIFIYNIMGNEIRNKFIKEDNVKSYKKTSHYMLDEILYEPIMIEKICEKYRFIDLEKIKKLINEKDEICFVGAGSSYYAGCILKYKYERLLNKRCHVILASEIDSFVIINKNILFIFITQSGETLDLCTALNKLKGKFPIVSLCNNVNSTIGYNSDLVYPLYAGEEIAVASTKAFMAMVLVGEIIVNSRIIENIELIHNNIKNIINNINDIEETARVVKEYNNVFYLGKGIDYIIGEEASLKLREVSYINSFSFCSGELKHGSIALIDKNTLCIGLLSDETYRCDINNSLEEVKSRGANTILIENDIYSLIVYVELLAYYTALHLNRSIDQPRNLAKSVTVN